MNVTEADWMELPDDWMEERHAWMEEPDAWMEEGLMPEVPAPPLDDAEVLQLVTSAYSYEKGSNPATPRAGRGLDLLQIVADAGCTLFVTPTRRTFIEIPAKGHRETWPLDSGAFRNWLNREFYARNQTLPGDRSLDTATSALEGRAQFEGTQQEIFLRVANVGDRVYLDLCNDQWEVVEITTEGWRIVGNPPVRFMRSQNMMALPRPLTGGQIGDLLKLTNIPPRDFPIILAVLINALRGRTPFPILELVGEQGSAKSTTQKILRRMIDPNQADVRGIPRRTEDIFVAAANNFVVSYDNVSRLGHDEQDVLCQISTGSGYAKRQNYTDFDEAVIKVGRPVLLSGIANVATNSDLVDRTLTLELPQIDAGARRTELDLEKAFNEQWASLLGALLDLMAGALRELPGVKLERPPRLADFALLGEAICKAGGFGNFSSLLETKRKAAALVAIESSPVAHAVLIFAREKHSFEGTVQELLMRISDPDFRSEGEMWVRSAKGLADALRRAKPELARFGVEIDLSKRSNQGRLVRITYRGSLPPASRPTQPSHGRLMPAQGK